MPRCSQALLTVSWILLIAGAGALAQQPQTYVQQAGSGLAPSVAAFPNLSIASGNVLCSNATVTYAGGQVTTLQNGVNYVYFDCGISVPKSSTSSLTGGHIPLAVVVAQGSSYGTSGLLDVRPWAVTRTEPARLVTDFPPEAQTGPQADAPRAAANPGSDPNVTTTAGTSGYLPYFSGVPYNVENSNVYQSGSSIGIGTMSPAALLSVGSSSEFQVNGSGDITWSGTATAGGTNQNITLTPNGTGQVLLNSGSPAALTAKAGSDNAWQVNSWIYPFELTASGVPPEGHDLVLQTRGTGDEYLEHLFLYATTSASLALGANTNVAVSSFSEGNIARGAVTPNLTAYSLFTCPAVGGKPGCPLDLDRDTPNAETLTYDATANCPDLDINNNGTWNVVNGTTLCLHVLNSHPTSPNTVTDIEQTARSSLILRFQNLAINTNTLAPAHKTQTWYDPLNVNDLHGAVSAYWPTSVSAAIPYRDWQFVTPISGGISSDSNFVNTNGDLLFDLNNSASSYKFRNASGSNLLTMDNTGNLTQSNGTASLNRLTVNADGTTGLTGNSVHDQIIWAPSGAMSGASAGSLILASRGSVSGAMIGFFTGSTTPSERMRITDTGNVGIGTTGPALQLQVAKAMAAGIVSQKYSVNGSSPTFDLSAGNTQQYACDGSGGWTITPTFNFAGSANLAKGEVMTFIFVQNGTTACTVTWPSNIHGAMPSSFLVDLGSVNVQRFVVSNNGSDLYATGPASVGMYGGTP